MPSRNRGVWSLVKGVVLLTVVGVFSQALGAEGGASELVILHTNSVTGHLFGCPT